MHLLALMLLAAPAAPAKAAPAAAPPAVADDVYPTARGTWGVSFFLPGGGSDSRLVGAEVFLADDLAIRGDLGLAFALAPGGSGQNKLFTLSGGVRSYLSKRSRVGLFVQPSVALGNENSPAITANSALFVRFGAGIGVEYFFTRNFSAGAILELALKLANLAGPAGTPVWATLGTDTSTLTANLYF